MLHYNLDFTMDIIYSSKTFFYYLYSDDLL